MELKVGDKVRIKNLIYGISYDLLGYERYSMQGRVVTVREILNECIKIEEHPGNWTYHLDWLEPIEQKENKLNLYYIYEPGHYEIYPKENGMFIKKHGEVEQLTITSTHDSDITKLKEENERLVNGIEDLQRQLQYADLLIVELQYQLPKFRLGQKVWFINENKIKSFAIDGIQIFAKGCIYNLQHGRFPENQVFETKEELLNTLSIESE